MGIKPGEPQGEPLEIEGMEGTGLSAEELATLDEGADEPARRDAAPEPPEPARAPELEPEPTPQLPTPEPPETEHDRILGELRTLPPDQLLARATDLYRQNVGQRGAIARANQQRRDRDLELEATRAELRRTESRFQAPPAQPDPPPALPKGLRLERDENGELYMPADAVRSLVESYAPKPPAPDPGQVAAARLRADHETIARVSPSHRATLERLEAARGFLLQGIRDAQTQYGHRLATVEDTANVIRAYGLDEQVKQHWPGVEFEDLLDLQHGGRLAERVVAQFARSWFPTGVQDPNASPRPVLRNGGDFTTPAAPPRAPAAPPRAPRLPLDGKPPTLHHRGGQRPEPDSVMNVLLDQGIDELVARHPGEIEKIIAGSFRELESETT